MPIKAENHDNYFTKHEAQNTLNKRDKINWNKDEKLRYIKIRSKGDGSVYYCELSPGVEKPKDNENFNFEYVSRFEGLLGMFEGAYGRDEIKRWVDDYYYNAKYGLKKDAVNNLELEVIRNQPNVEKKLLGKSNIIKL